LKQPQLVGLGLAAAPALHRRSDVLGAVADVEAEAVLADQLGEVALRVGSPDLIGAGRATRELDQVAGLAAGPWLTVLVAITSALAAAVANSLVAQNATARLLYSMARDRTLPPFLAHVNEKRRVPERAVLLVAVVSLILGVFFVGQIEFLSTLVNFGALFAFLMLHVSVAVYHLVKRRQRTYGMHLAVPLIGFAIIAYVLWNADVDAKIGGLIWLAIGVIVIVVRKLTGRGITLNLNENARPN